MILSGRGLASSEAIVQAKPNDVEAVVKRRIE